MSKKFYIPRAYGKTSLKQSNLDWSNLVGEEAYFTDKQFRSEVLHFAQEIMKCAKNHILSIIEDLQKHNYRFASEGSVFKEPEPEITECIETYRSKGVHILISLEAWLKTVGGVNLMGTLPGWDKTAYIFDDFKEKVEDVLITDPLVVELPISYFDVLYEEWQDQQEESGPFRIEIAPDDLHKANISGGPAYCMSTSSPAVDAIIINEVRCTSFMNYLRVALRWKGFPGIEYIEDSNNFITPHRKNLI